MAFQVSPKARDITIQVQDSCNLCCWCCRQVDDETKLYINSKGQAVAFDPKKAQSERAAIARSLQHLHAKIDQVAASSPKGTTVVKERLLEELDDLLTAEDTPSITLDVIERINAVFKKAMRLSL